MKKEEMYESSKGVDLTQLSRVRFSGEFFRTL
jgi:hypothetical protein